MNIRTLQKIVIFPMLGLFLITGSCSGKKDSKETQESNQKQLADDNNALTHPDLDFTLQSTNDKKISLTDFLGNKIIIMNFWDKWCPYCITEIPRLNKIKTTLADHVQVLSVDILESPEKVKKMAQQKGIKYDVLLDQKGEVARRYRVKGTPTSIVIDKKGNIAYYGYELDRAEQVIKSLIGN
jgi:peroxiredoxin